MKWPRRNVPTLRTRDVEEVRRCQGLSHRPLKPQHHSHTISKHNAGDMNNREKGAKNARG